MGGGGLCCPLDPSYTRKKKPLSSHVIPCKLPHHIPCTTGLSWQKWNFKKKKKKYQQAIGYEWTQNVSFVSVKKKKTKGPPPPHAKGKKCPASWRLELWRQKLHTIFGGWNRHELGKNGLRMHHLHPFFKNFLGETPNPPPHCEKIKKFPSLAFPLDLQLRWKFFPHHVYRWSEIWKQKLHTILGGWNRHELGKNGLRMHHLHPFFKNFLGETPNPPPTTARR